MHTPARHIVDRLPDPDPTVLDQALAAPATQDAHDEAARAIPALEAIELRQPGCAAPAADEIRIAVWNLERCKHAEASCARLAQTGAAVALLSEMDLGMARSGQRHTTRDLADGLGFGYAYGVEFVELGHGLGQEVTRHTGQPNRVGLHGNAILSALPLREPAMLRLARPGAWFLRDWHHRRIGGRMALGAVIDFGGQPLGLVSTHLENLSTPDERSGAMAEILDFVETMAPGAPAIVAGDLNTAGLPETGLGDGELWFDAPEPYEPMFGILRQAGFDWRRSNLTTHTRRALDDGRRPPKLRRVDWILIRGLVACNPLTWAAVDQHGHPLSDHELITVDLKPHRPAPVR